MKVHHAVFCVHGDNQERAADLWRELGLTFAELVLDDLEIRVLIDWDAGIELVSPLPDAGEPALAFTTFLETQGEGLYSLAMSVDEVDGPEAIARRYGARGRVPAAPRGRQLRHRRGHAGTRARHADHVPGHRREDLTGSVGRGPPIRPCDRMCHQSMQQTPFVRCHPCARPRLAQWPCRRLSRRPWSPGRAEGSSEGISVFAARRCTSAYVRNPWPPADGRRSRTRGRYSPTVRAQQQTPRSPPTRQEE